MGDGRVRAARIGRNFGGQALFSPLASLSANGLAPGRR
jgi:hypothetical protein